MSAPADETKQDESGPSESETELTCRQDKLIAALLAKPTQEAAAAKAKIPKSTMYRWLRDEAFLTRYRAAQRDLFAHAMARLQGATSEALETLREVMTDKASPAAARVTAARTVIDFARQHIETSELEARLAALEERTR